MVSPTFRDPFEERYKAFFWANSNPAGRCPKNTSREIGSASFGPSTPRIAVVRVIT